MPNKLPDTVEDKSIASFISYYTDTITVCGVEGKLSYKGGTVIDAITWKTEESDDKLADTVLKKTEGEIWRRVQEMISSIVGIMMKQKTVYWLQLMIMNLKLIGLI